MANWCILLQGKNFIESVNYLLKANYSHEYIEAVLYCKFAYGYSMKDINKQIEISRNQL